MADLAPGVTRYPLGRRRLVKVDGVGLAGLAVLFVGGNAVALAMGARAPYVVVLALVCALVVPATIVLPFTWLRFLVGAVVEVAVLGWLGAQDELAAGYALSWFVSTAVGAGLLAALLFRRWWSRRLSSAEGAPPSELDPRGQRDVGVLAWWRDADFEYEMVDPTPAVVLDAVRAMDGRSRAIVSVYRGKGRLDVAGDAAGPVLVQQSDDRRKWHQVTSPVGATRPVPKQTVSVAGYAVVYPQDRVTDLRSAETAMSTWLATGERDQRLSWWDDTALDPAVRPKYLKDTD